MARLLFPGQGICLFQIWLILSLQISTALAVRFNHFRRWPVIEGYRFEKGQPGEGQHYILVHSELRTRGHRENGNAPRPLQYTHKLLFKVQIQRELGRIAFLDVDMHNDPNPPETRKPPYLIMKMLYERPAAGYGWDSKEFIGYCDITNLRVVMERSDTRSRDQLPSSPPSADGRDRSVGETLQLINKVREDKPIHGYYKGTGLKRWKPLIITPDNGPDWGVLTGTQEAPTNFYAIARDLAESSNRKISRIQIKGYIGGIGITAHMPPLHDLPPRKPPVRRRKPSQQPGSSSSGLLPASGQSMDGLRAEDMDIAGLDIDGMDFDDLDDLDGWNIDLPEGSNRAEAGHGHGQRDGHEGGGKQAGLHSHFAR